MPEPGEIPADAAWRALVELYDEAEVRLRELVREALESEAIGTAQYRERQLRAVRATIADLRRRGAEAAGVAIETAYSAGLLATDRTLDTRLGGSFGGGVHRRAVAILVDNLRQPLDRAAITVGRRTEDVLRKAGLKEAALAVATGAGPQDTSKALQQRLVDEGVADAVTGLVDVGGRRWPLATYAEMVARTTVREAVTQGTVNRLEQVGEDLVQITEHRNACPICVPFQGKTYSLSGRDPRFPRATRLPPLHPNCRHVVAPARESFKDFERELAEVAEEPVERAPEPEQPVLERRAEAIRAELDALPPATDVGRRDPVRLARIGAMVREAADQLGTEERLRERLADAERRRGEGREIQRHRELTEDEMTAFFDAGREILDLRQRLRTARRDDLREVLQLVRPGFGEFDARTRARGRLRADLAEVARYLPAEWLEAVQTRSGGEVAIRSLGSRRRAYYDRIDRQAHVRPGDHATLLHELGHAVEHLADPAINGTAANFYDARTAGEELVPLRQLRPRSGYRSDERTRPDRFADPYAGKWYGRDSSEIVSMGLEGVFYGRYDLRDRDLEHHDLTLGMLAAL